MTRKVETLWAAILLVSIALILTSLYVSARISTASNNQLLSDPLNIFSSAFFRHIDDRITFWPSVKQYNREDMIQNVVNGFNLSAGAKFGTDAVTNHMPGVFQYLSIFYRAFGVNQASPSPELANAAYIIAAFACSLVLVGSLYVGCVWLAFPWWLSTGFAIVVGLYLSMDFDFSLPISETFTPLFLFLSSVLLFRALFSNDVTQAVRLAIGLGFVSALSILFGFTLAPTNLLFALTAVSVIMFHTIKSSQTVVSALTRDRSCLVMYGAAIATIIMQVITVDFGDAFFWAVTFNVAGGEPVQPLQMLLSSFLVHWDTLWAPRWPFGAQLPIFGAMCLITLASLWRQQDKRIRVLLFIGIVLAAGILTQWRKNYDYKGWGGLGLFWALVLIAIAPRIDRSAVLSRSFAAPLILFGLLQYPVLTTALANLDSALPPRKQALDDVGVCRFRQTSACRCLQLTVYRPSYFLENDVRQCPNRDATWAAPDGRNPVTRKWLIDDIKRNDRAFLVAEEAQMNINFMPSEAIDYWNRVASCVAYDSEFRLCYTPVANR